MNNICLPWTSSSSRLENTWHTMCSYLGAFPPALARSLICMLSDENDIVLDPFCGRGTTLLEARLNKRIPLASDLNPIAYAITRAKNTEVELDEILSRINKLEADFNLGLYLPEAMVQNDNISLIYHSYVLAKLCYLRRKLLQSQEEIDFFLIGLVLGIMHGLERNDGSSMYGSINMPNTFSMSPEYVRKFVQTNNLQRVDRDIFQLLRDKAIKLFSEENIKGYKGMVARVDAKKLSKDPAFSEYVGKVKLILTSPPYLNIVNYAKQNWIRLWFMNEDVGEVSEKLDDQLTLSESLDFLETTAVEMKKMLIPGGIAVLVLGDVARSKNNIISPARELIRRLHEKSLYNYIGCISDYLPVGQKTTKIWGDKKGCATQVDRIIILSDEKPTFSFNQIMDGFTIEKKENVSNLNQLIDADLLQEYAMEFAGI